jgi:hypothetical protein
MEQRIVGFHRDEEGAFVADLECGHRQHVRHAPPFQNRAWIATEAGRQERLGTLLTCPFCDMPELPPGAALANRTKTFTT